jgi:hypothetical protein
MKRILQKRMWLAGASLLAIVLGSGDANAVVFGTPEGVQYLIPSTGYYDFTVAGAQGGMSGGTGGFGAIVGGELFFHAGDTLDIVVGGAGASQANYAGAGGGGSGFNPRASGLPGIGHGGHPAGPASYGGGGGGGIPVVTGPGVDKRAAQS